jgi:hypothetical protein
VGRNSNQWIGCLQVAQQQFQTGVLTMCEGDLVGAFDFDADREIVAALPAFEVRDPGMPRALLAGHELQQFAIAADQEVRRHAQLLELLKTLVLRRIEGVGEQAFDRVTAELARWQRNAVNHQQVNRATRRTLIAVRRDDAPGAAQPAEGVDTLGRCQLISRRCMR